MIDIDDGETLIEIDRQAKNLAVLSDARVERELAAIRERASALFTARGETDIEAFFHADKLIQRTRVLIANHRRRLRLPGG